MIDGRKLNNRMIVHCTTASESQHLLRYLGYKNLSHYNYSICVRFFDGITSKLDYAIDSINNYQVGIADGTYPNGYIITLFKDILLPEKLARFKNSVEGKFNDRWT